MLSNDNLNTIFSNCIFKFNLWKIHIHLTRNYISQNHRTIVDKTILPCISSGSIVYHCIVTSISLFNLVNQSIVSGIFPGSIDDQDAVDPAKYLKKAYIASALLGNVNFKQFKFLTSTFVSCHFFQGSNIKYHKMSKCFKSIINID